MEVDLSLDDFTDFTFEDYAFETEVKSEDDKSPSNLNNVNSGAQLQSETTAQSVQFPTASTSFGNAECAIRNVNNLDTFQLISDSPEVCLAKNQDYQRFIVDHLIKLQAALSKNREEQTNYEEKEYAKEQLQSKRTRRVPKYMRPINLFAAPYFRDARGMVPPDNEDTKLKRKNYDIDAYLTQAKPFSPADYDKLLMSVKENVRTLIMEPQKSRRDFLKNKVRFKLLPKDEETCILQEIADLEDSLDTLKEISVDKYLNEYEDRIDWLTVSAAYMEGSKTSDECEYIWRNYLAPYINKDAFSHQEDEELTSIARSYDFHDWDGIARELNTNRTAIQCFERFQSRLNEKILKKYWTKEEDERLRKVVEKERIGKYIPWHKVVLYMDGRTRLQITNRWFRSAVPGAKRGPWHVGEDALLVAAVKKYGNSNWKKVKELILGRSNYLCRERYTNTLIEGVKIGEWTPKEDRLLIKLTQENNFGKWAKICLSFPTRTDNMCLQRAQRLRAFNPGWFVPKEGTGKYDEVRQMSKYDKRIAPSSTCTQLNRKRDVIRVAAHRKLLSVLQKVMQLDIKSLNDIDLTDANPKFMIDLQTELLRDVPKEDDWEPHYSLFNARRKNRKNKRGVCRRHRQKIHTRVVPTDSEDDEFLISPDENAEDDEHQHVRGDEDEQEKYYDEVLDSLLKPRALLKTIKPVNVVHPLTRKEQAEYLVLKKYLFEMFNCTYDIDEEVKDRSALAECAESIPRVMSWFILPPVNPKGLPVFPPNHTNLTTMEVFKYARFTAIKSASYIERSQFLFQILSTDVSNVSNVKCVYCLKQMGTLPSASQNEMQNVKLMSIRQNFETIDEKLKEAVAYEASKDDNSEACNCKAIMEMKPRITLLRRRFVSMFLWSCLLTNTMPNEEQKCFNLKRPYYTYKSADTLNKRACKQNASDLETFINGDEDEEDEDEQAVSNIVESKKKKPKRKRKRKTRSYSKKIKHF